MAGASPAFRDFLGEWQRQIRAFWLVDLAPLRGAALLIGGAVHMLRALLGAERLERAFPYLHRPRLVLLDEATSATDLASESQLYRLLLEENFSLISVGHRPSLRAFHQRELRLDGRGGWQLLPIEA